MRGAIRGLIRFDRRRWLAFGAILGFVYALAFGGLGAVVFIPFLGGPLFLAGLMIWFVPGVLFAWTGLFVFHEFGASPAGWAGHAVMFAFYAGLAVLLSWPFARRRAGPGAAPGPGRPPGPGQTGNTRR